MERFKARLVAQGFSQRPGWDFDETFAPTVRLSVIRAILAIVAVEDLECDSLDITTAYLNATLDEEIYMKPPEGFEQYTKDGHLLYCLLLKALYGLKQGGRQWYLKFSSVMKEMGFTRVKSESCVYVWKRGESDRVIVPSYVDDLFVAAKDSARKEQVKKELSRHFQLRDLGPIKHYLGIHITRDRSKRTLSLSQRQYCIDMLEECGLLDCNPVATPMRPGLHLSTDNSPTTDAEKEQMKFYQFPRMVGKVMYLAQASRPDITWTAHQLACFNSNPGMAHVRAMKYLVRYIAGTINYKITYGPTPHPADFITSSDADYAGERNSGRSTSGYVVMMAGGAVSSSAKLQTRVTYSTTESEFIAGNSASREITFFRFTSEDLGYKITLPRPLAMDNQSAIKAAKNPEYGGRMKHLNPINLGFRESVEKGEVAPYYISTDDMAANILTKSLDRHKVLKCCKMLGLTGDEITSSGGRVGDC